MKTEERSKQIWWFLWVCASWFRFPVSPKAFLLPLGAALHLLPLSTRHVADLPASSATRELGQLFSFVPPKPERALDHFSCETAPFSIDSPSLARFAPLAEVGLLLLRVAALARQRAQGFEARSADSGVLGPNERVGKGLSGGREGSSPPREIVTSQQCGSFSVETWISPPYHVHCCTLLENGRSWRVFFLFNITTPTGACG